jgi:hypothetical protein
LRELSRSHFTLNKVSYCCLYRGLSHYLHPIGLPPSVILLSVLTPDGDGRMIL